MLDKRAWLVGDRYPIAEDLDIQAQKRYMITRIGDIVYFLMTVTELHVVPEHAMDFIVVSTITPKS